MSLAGLSPTRKAKLRLRPSPVEGHYIKYQLIRKGWRLVDIQTELSLSTGMVPLVIFGRRRSARIEAEIARILEKPSWNDVVTEARAATGRLPVPTRPRQEKRRAG